MVEQMLSWHALDLHTELSPRRTFFYGGPQMFVCLIGYCNDIILCAFLQVVLSGLVWYI